MSRFRRRLMMGGVAGGNSYDGVCQYLETDSASYFDTGLLASSALQYHLKFYVPASAGRIFGVGGTTPFCLQIENWGGLQCVYYYGNYSNVANMPLDTAGNYEYDNLQSANSVRLGIGVPAYDWWGGWMTVNATTFQSADNFRIGSHGFAGLKIYNGQKLYLNGTLVRDYLTVYRGSVGYLYDQVTGTLLPNADTGRLTIGPDVV